MEMEAIDVQSGPPDAAVNVIKGGETVIGIGLIRSARGLSLTYKAHPSVEEFFRSAAVGEPQDVRGLGRYWVPIGKDPLLVYQVAIEPMRLEQGKGVIARFDKVGKLPTEQDDNRDYGIFQTINMSFLKMVGASEGAGITFGIKGVYTTEQVRTLRDSMQEAAKRFYQVYLKPVNMHVAVVTQEY